MWNNMSQDYDRDGRFGDPFLMHSTAVFPQDLRSTFNFCLALYRQFKLFASATEKLVSFHLTDLEFQDQIDDDHRDTIKKALIKTIKLYDKLMLAGVEESIYGNSFVILAKPFDRYLLDNRDGRYQTYSLAQFSEKDVKYNWADLTYTIPDPRGNGHVTLNFFDLPSPEIERFDVVTLDPRYVRLDKPHLSDDVRVIYTPPADMESRVKNNVHHEIGRTPKMMLAAIAKSKDFRFDAGEVFHFKRPTPIGVSDSGWGFPPILWHFDDLYQIQVYRRTDQVIALDYMFPFRVVTPAGAGGQGNGPIAMVHGQEFRSQVQRMFEEQRKDRTKIHGLGVPIDLHTLGGDGKTMVLADVIKIYTDMFLEGMGLPAEIYHGTLAVNASPIALRILARQFNWMFEGFSNLTNFIAKGLQSTMGHHPVEIFLKAPSIAYSDEVMKMKMQLAANGETSRKSIYPELDIADPVSARVDRIMEDQEIQRQTQERGEVFNREMQQGSMADIVMANMQAQQGGGGQMPQGGAPAGPGGAPNYQASPSDDPVGVKQRAQDIAGQWDQMDTGTRRKEMANCRAVNENLYAMAMQALKELRNSRASQANQPQNTGQPPV